MNLVRLLTQMKNLRDSVGYKRRISLYFVQDAYIQKDSRRASPAGITFQMSVITSHRKSRSHFKHKRGKLFVREEKNIDNYFNFTHKLTIEALGRKG
jgi:hypothetical protein